MILLPVTHNRIGTRRYPIITLYIIAINILVFLITVYTDKHTNRKIIKSARNIISYYEAYPCLNLPEDAVRILVRITFTRKKLFLIHSNKTGCENYSLDYKSENEDWTYSPQKHLNGLVSELKSNYRNISYIKYGYIPSEGGLIKLITSMFMHGGFSHIFFNMWFFLLCGHSIEDLWGRSFYIAFYLIGGIAATHLHVIMFPDSNIPLIGASGAISALMGAFMIRLYNAKIRFYYFIFFGRFLNGFFNAKASIMLPLWLIEQIWGAVKDTGGSGGVAFWAHIGGFLFGAGTAVVLKLSGMEKNIEDSVPVYVSYRQKLLESSTEEIILYLQKIIAENENDAISHTRLGDMFLRQQNSDAAYKAYRSSITLYLKNGFPKDAMKEYRRHQHYFPNLVLLPADQVKLARAMAALKEFDDAADCYKDLADFYAKEAEKTPDPKKSMANVNRETYEKLCEMMKDKEIEEKYGVNLNAIDNNMFIAKGPELIRLKCESCGQIYRLKNNSVPKEGIRQKCKKCKKIAIIKPINGLIS